MEQGFSARPDEYIPLKNVRDFCRERKMTVDLENAFIAYCKSNISRIYDFSNGDTPTGILNDIEKKDIERIWSYFISDLKSSYLE